MGTSCTTTIFCFFLLLCATIPKDFVAEGLGCNWGTRATHPLPGDIVVRMLKDNGFNKVKLFEPDPNALIALGNSGIEVMLGIPNEFLAPLSSSVDAAITWVRQNVSSYITKYGVNISYIAVGNEPFLQAYKQMFQQSTFLALKNIAAALVKAGLAQQVKVTVPLNADVYQSDTNLPSGGDFRADIRPLVLSIIQFLSKNNYPLTINIYPFLSLYADPHFPIDFAFFSGASSPIVDGPLTYTNVFDANYDTLIWALQKNGYANMPVIIGEVGWPTDGNINANINYARRFNQGLMDRIVKGIGTPKRKTPPEVYIFGLIDEDAKSIDPGKFERHWGMFYYDGSLKYPLNMGNGRSLIPAKGVKYLAKQWCVMAAEASISDPNFQGSMDYACQHADCTSLGNGSSCGALDAKSNASYAFNMFFQTQNQRKEACVFSNLGRITPTNPSQGTCRFPIMIDITKQNKRSRPRTSSSSSVTPTSKNLLFFMVVFLVSMWKVGVLR